MEDCWRLTLKQASDRIRAGELTPTDLTSALLRHIEQVEPRVLAWTRLCPEQALEEARRLTEALRAGSWLGPLHGIPLGIKDIFYTAGVETSAGSSILKGFIPERDAAAVARLRAAGAIILGKTATTEFACFDPAPTRNPYNLEHTPGGSSSGSAAAVAAGMCYGALGTQTGGSILRPAAYCGVVGLKPTYDLISRERVVPLAWSLDHVGPIARTVEDAGLLLDALAPGSFRPEPGPADLPGRVVGIPDRYFLEKADTGTLAAFSEAERVLERLGLRVREVRLPGLFEAGVSAGSIVMRVEAAAFHQENYLSRASEYSPKLRALVESGLRIPAVSYVRAQQVRRAAIQEMVECFREIDFLATPATPAPAPQGLSWTGDLVFNAPFTTFGLPALTVPMGLGTDGLPLGLQLAAAHYAEEALLRLGMAFEIGNRRHYAAATMWCGSMTNFFAAPRSKSL